MNRLTQDYSKTRNPLHNLKRLLSKKKRIARAKLCAVFFEKTRFKITKKQGHSPKQECPSFDENPYTTFLRRYFFCAAFLELLN